MNFRLALFFGAALRLAALPLPGTHDTAVWKIWSYGAATQGVGRAYGVGGNPPERGVFSLHGAEATVDYPPLAVAELAVVGHVFRAINHGTYPDDRRLIVAVKIPALTADAGLLALIYFAVRRFKGEAAARTAAVMYWLNPAVVLAGAALGYLDTLFVLPALGAIVAAYTGMPIIAGASAAAALLTKPQAVVLLPAMAWAMWRAESRDGRQTRRLLVAGTTAVITTVVIVAPVLAAGALPNLLNAMSRLGAHDMLSANGCNVWWIVGYLLRVRHSFADMGLWTAVTAPARILAISRVMDLGYPNPRTIGTLMVLSVAIWAIWTARVRRDLWIASALAALLAHDYATLSAQVHENHLFAAVPLLVVAAAGRPGFRPVLFAVSAIFALNLNLFYGISEDVGYAIPRSLTIIDMTIWLAAVNCAALVWHARAFHRECSTASVSRPAPAPA